MDAVFMAQNKVKKMGLDKNLKFQVANAGDLPYKDQEFDTVYSSGSLNSFFEKGPDEIYRVLKDFGKVVVIEVVVMGHIDKNIQIRLIDKTNVSIMPPDKLVSEFHKLCFSTLFTKIYFDQKWWDVYYRERDNNKEIKDEWENYKEYKDILGIGLFIFSKGSENYCI